MEAMGAWWVGLKDVYAGQCNWHGLAFKHCIVTPRWGWYISLPDRTPKLGWYITQSMQHSLLWPMHSHPHPSLFTFVQPFCFCPDCFHQSWHLQTRTPLADSQEAWLSSMVSWLGLPVAPIMWRKCGECSGREDIGTLKETSANQRQ